MHSLQSAIINEAVKIGSRKKAIVFLLLTALVPIVAVILANRVQNGFGVAAATAAYLPVLVLNLLTTLVVPLLIFMVAADQFAGEIGDKTARIALLRPVARWKVFAGKQIALLLVIVVHLAVGFLISLLASCFLADKENMFSGWFHALLAYIAAILPMLALSSIAVFISQWFKNGSGALAVSILLYAACKLGAFVIPQLNAFSPAAYTDWYMLWLGGAAAAAKIASIFTFLLACWLIFFSAGYTIFDKKEF